MKNTLPGTLWLNRGRWNWKVRLPGEKARKNYALRAPGQQVALAEAKGRDLAESVAWRMWEKASRHDTAHDTCKTLDDVCGLFIAWAETYYRRADGRPTGEAYNCEIALRPLRARCGRFPIDDVSYTDILEVREGLIADGLCRTTIEKRVGAWKRLFAWALENRHCSPQTKSEVWALSNLKRHRSAAPEGEPVRPVKHRDVKAALPFMPPTLRAMVLLQELCGARPGEICAMRPCDIEQRHGVWVYRPTTHKTQHKGGVRVVVIGPLGQRVLSPYMEGSKEAPCFAPARAVAERNTVKRLNRKTRVQPSQRDRSKADPAWTPGDAYTTLNYGQSVGYAIKAARKAGVEVADWSPNQLRHACGTRVRRKYGPDAARAVLGHSSGSLRITDRYTIESMEQETVKAASRPMLLIG